MDSTRGLVRRLIQNDVSFVLVGGMAGTIYGSSLVTEDVDICAPLVLSNIARLLSALDGLERRWRMLPKRPPLTTVADELVGYKKLYLTTTVGQLDVLTEIAGIGEYDTVARRSETVHLSERTIRVLSIDALITSRKALNRPKDLPGIAQLEAIRDRNRNQ